MAYAKYLLILLLIPLNAEKPPIPVTDLKGHHFKIALAENVSGTSFVRDSNGNIIEYSGPMVELLRWLPLKLKFNYTVVPSTYRLDPLPNGTWVGVYGLLVKKEVDFVFMAIPMDSTSFRIADFTSTVYEDPMLILTPPINEEHRIAAIVKPFSLKVWVSFIVSAAVVTFALRFLFTGMRQIENRQRRARSSIHDLLVRNVQLIFSQGGFEGPAFRSLVYRMILCGWMLGIFVLVNSYSSTLISYATVTKLEPQVETIEDLAYRSELQPVLVKGINEHTYLEPQSEPFRILGGRFKKSPQNLVNTTIDAVAKVSTGCCAYVSAKVGLDFYSYRNFQTTGECRLSISKTPQLWYYFAFATQKGHRYTHLLSIEILRAKEMGLIQRWVKNTNLRPYKCLNVEKPKIRPLILKDLRDAFVLLLVGASVSMAVFILEKFSAANRKIKANAAIRKPNETSDSTN